MKVFALIFVVFISLSKAQDNERRIVNGQDADVEDFPHVLALYDQGRYFCGASAIARYWGEEKKKI